MATASHEPIEPRPQKRKAPIAENTLATPIAQHTLATTIVKNTLATPIVENTLATPIVENTLALEAPASSSSERATSVWGDMTAWRYDCLRTASLPFRLTGSRKEGVRRCSMHK